jgi:Transposase zinc-binding domain/Putative transposase
VSRPALEVADIFRHHGPAWRQANAGHVSLGQLKVMSAIERCRTAALGGHVARCENAKCGLTSIAYNSCRNRHCPKCQGAAARQWLAAREAELLPVPYFHVVFSLPAPIAAIACHNKAAIYDILFKASAETLTTIAADPKHLGGRIGVLSVLHSWGSALTHHPHVHMIVPGGGLALATGEKDDGETRTNKGELLPPRARALTPVPKAGLGEAHRRSWGWRPKVLRQARRARRCASLRRLSGALRNSEWVVYSKRPFGGPEDVLRYLARYTARARLFSMRPPWRAI